MPTITIDPVSRIEGHLRIEVTVDVVNGVQKVTDAKCAGDMFRGFEQILLEKDPCDTPILTQRICGVCPVSHALASCLGNEQAFGLTGTTLPANGRILRNLVLGANYIQSHILHFYHLAALDFINTTGILDMPPWRSRYVTPDMVGGSTAQTLVGHYVTALEKRRKAHQMGAIYGGKLPHVSSFVVGGCTENPTADKTAAFRTLLTDLRSFIDNVYIPDVLAVAAAFPDYYNIGRGCGNLLAYGVFDLDATRGPKLLQRGRYADGATQIFDPTTIYEYTGSSWYTQTGGANPASATTTPDAAKPGAYSWIKAPRIAGKPHETGPLARMWINGDYTRGISVLDRHAARALECKKVADAMDGWLNQLTNQSGNTATAYVRGNAPTTAVSGRGLTEAARGALGHWIDIGLTGSAAKVKRYQVITPTAWNASPRDDAGTLGPMEQALVGTPINDINQPVELLRIVHSYDPCLSCSVHMVRPDSKAKPVVIPIPACPL